MLDITLIYKCRYTNKHQRIMKGQSKMDNPQKLATQVTQDEEKKNPQHNMF